jgi:SAM-dependent methyltransferase
MSQIEDYLAHSFREVDAGDIGKMMRCLTFMDGLPAFQTYKATVLEKLDPQPGGIVADLGCGLGFDVQRLAGLVGSNGIALGIDSSRSLLARARLAGEAAACFLQADIHRLPLANASLGACKVDRTLQHVAEPAAVLREIFRTLRPGGIVVCSEPDWSTFVIDDPDPVAGKIAALFCQGFRNPRIAQELNTLLESTGFIDRQRSEVTLATPDFPSADIVFDLSQSASRLAVSLQSEDPLGWLANVRQRPLHCSVALVIQFARRP